MEGAATGAFNGLGQTMIPSISSVIFNLLRIPLALLLSATPLGLNGIWWAVCISSVLKGTILVFWYAFYVRRNKIYQLEGADQATLIQSEQESAPPASEA